MKKRKTNSAPGPYKHEVGDSIKIGLTDARIVEVYEDDGLPENYAVLYKQGYKRIKEDIIEKEGKFEVCGTVHQLSDSKYPDFI